MCKLGKGNFLPVEGMERNSGCGGLTPFLSMTLDRGEWLRVTSAASLLGKNSGIH
jgi:hypothetical protein